jgi:hypothetical protein
MSVVGSRCYVVWPMEFYGQIVEVLGSTLEYVVIDDHLAEWIVPMWSVRIDEVIEC